MKSKRSIPDRTLTFRTLSEIPRGKISWLWQPRVARQSLTVLTGRTSVGKSWILCQMVSRLSRGLRLENDPRDQHPTRTAWIGAEDDPGVILGPRLDDLGCDTSMVDIIDGVNEFSLDLRKDIPLIRRHVETRKIELVILDPLNAFLGRTDSYRDADMRAILHPLQKVAEEASCAVVAIVHQNKGATDLVEGINGSVAYGAAARCVLGVRRGEGGDRRVFWIAKNNLVPEDEKPRPQAFTLIGGFRWRGDATTEDLRTTDKIDSTQPVRDEARDLLREWLKYEPLPEKVIHELAEAHGLGWRTVEKAKGELGVESVKTPTEWVWRLPTELTSTRDEATPPPESAQKRPGCSAIAAQAPLLDPVVVSLTPSDPVKCSSCGVPLSPYRSHRCSKEPLNGR